jgi:hypothetical protein
LSEGRRRKADDRGKDQQSPHRHSPFAFRPLIEMLNRFAVFRIDAGSRPVFFAIAFKSMVLAISTKARSDAIDQW